MIPSLLQIPSAVSDSKLHSVLPNNGKGDFQFDRSTGATRINRDGLIEEVGYFSSELVQNGNFSELGSELVTNGDFATNSDWTLATGWTINNSKLVGNSIFGNAVQNINFTNGKTYKVIFTISDYVKGKVRFQFTGGATVNGTARDANGVYTQYIVATANHTDFKLRGVSDSGGFTGKIDNVSVKQVDPNDRWTVINADSNNFVELTQGQARLKFLNTSPVTEFTATAPYESGKTYKLIVDIATVTSGGVKIQANGILEVFDTAGVTTRIINPTGASNISFYRATSNVDITLNSVSLVEVQGDRPRLSYDITNGVVENKPHLLLEPSATNYSTNSENPSSWFYVKYGSGSVGTITTGKTDMFGSTNAVQVDFPANAENASLWFGSLTSALSSGTETSSVYIKLVGNETPDKIIQIRTGGVASAITISGTEFVRYTASKTISSNEAINLKIRPSQGTSSGGFSIIVCQPQSEVTAYATSYIPTAGTTITRAAETCNNSKPSVNSTEGVLYAEISALDVSGGNREITLSDGTTSNRVIVQYRDNSNIRIILAKSTGDEFDTGVLSFNTVALNKIAIKYKTNDFAFWVNGIEIYSDNTGNTFNANTLSTINFDGGTGGNDFYGKVKGLAVYNEALTDAQLIELTS